MLAIIYNRLESPVLIDSSIANKLYCLLFSLLTILDEKPVELHRRFLVNAIRGINSEPLRKDKNNNGQCMIQGVIRSIFCSKQLYNEEFF